MSFGKSDRGYVYDVLERVFAELVGHEDHFMTCGICSDNIEFSEIRCHQCKAVIVSGSRELIEIVFLSWCNPPSSSS